MCRQVQAEGGFATVLAKGEPEAGTIMLVLTGPGGRAAAAWERMPHPDGTRRWTLARQADADDPAAFDQWVDRRRTQDPDLWIVELDIPQAERFVSPR